MKVRKAIKRIAALGVGTTMLGATIFGAVAADLSQYPDPLFIKDGKFDGIIVVGDSAAASDVIGSVDIATAAQYRSRIESTVKSSVGSVQLSGDVVEIGEPSDLLELNESIGDVRETLTEHDLEALRGGIINTDEGTTDYNQYLRFERLAQVGNQTRNEIPSGRVVFQEDEDDVVGDFLLFNDGEVMFEYQLEFEEGLESEVESGTNDLIDLEDELITILGEEYSVVETDLRNTSTQKRVKLELIGGEVIDTLEEGETKVYTIDGVEYEINVLIVADNANNGEGSVKFKVNGFVSDELVDGETEILEDGTEIGVREILPNEAEEISGGDIVEFYLGANKIEWTDNNYSDDSFDRGGVEIDEEAIEDASVKILGSDLEIETTTAVSRVSRFRIDSIFYRLEADSPKGDIFVPPGQGLREFLDEPQGMLNPNWDIRYEGLLDTGVSVVKFDARGDDSYDLRFTNREGLNYNVPLVDNSNDKSLGFNVGDEDDDLIWIEADNTTAWNETTPGAGIFGTPLNYTIINEDDFFILTDDNDETGFTHVLSYESIDTANNQLVFTDEGVGQREITYTGVEGCLTGSDCATGNLVVGGNTFKVYVGPGASANNLTIDLTNDGVVGDGLGFNDGMGPFNLTAKPAPALFNYVVYQGTGAAAQDANTINNLNMLKAIYPHHNGVSSGINTTICGQENETGNGPTAAGPGNLSVYKRARAMVVVDGGGVIDLGPCDTSTIAALTATNDESFNVTLHTLREEFDEDKTLGNFSPVDEIHVIEMGERSQNEVDISLVGQGLVAGVVRMEGLDEEDLRQGLSDYGIFFELTDNRRSREAEELTIEYPLSQRGAQVFITYGEVGTTASAKGGITTTTVTPINVGAAKLASEVGDITAQNAIVVGGPCANAVAAELLGNPEECWSSIPENKAVIKLFEHANGNVALLVAGRTALDTRRAARVLANAEDYDLSGSEVEVTGTSLTDITVSAPRI